MITPCRQPTTNQIRRNYVVGTVCIAAFTASSFAYTLPGLTAKAASFVVGYWAALPFVHLATGHGFGFKKKRAALISTSGAGGRDCGDAQGAVENPSLLQPEVALTETGTLTSPQPLSINSATQSRG